jgi:hypothetical protein
MKTLFTMRNCVCQKHATLQLKLKKQLTYNCYVTIPWVFPIGQLIISVSPNLRSHLHQVGPTLVSLWSSV